ncbi:FAD-dependent oxidoreductase [Halomonas urumqiensis]|uniref:3-oxosteroid 1-dehydrogenase n=1 Tax=Halomonas urumqiensis TaxID=1684789 RepID=A0A2N7UJ40_9GAMM|nr:FAD-dependent oxidoreductase [Halomonas urumqiensis]PMR80457.1 3-oxosteroid 1-dehydrogenase [Halomonas urumqiensis]PTB01698.1 FAD-binding protein [Halomonas urumqiensis]GHE22209.1 FAD-binding dehydrogenase [Halomonas urumqiensis]
MTHEIQVTRADLRCDVLVIGAGAGGLATAITAAKQGLEVIVLEKAEVFGGTTAFSGGVLWIPGNHHGRAQNPDDTRDAAREYLRTEASDFFDTESVEAFLGKGPEMVDFFERETAVRFVPTLYPDYHPTRPGGVDIGRSILAAPFDLRGLGKEMRRMRPPLETITFIGMMFNSSNADLKHFFNATRSLTSFGYVVKRLAIHLKEMALYRRGINVTSGNALAASLAKSAFDLGIPIHTGAPARELLYAEGRIHGARAVIEGREVTVAARRGVVLACGGFAQDLERIRRAYPHLERGGEHYSPVPESNTGDGLAMVEALGVTVNCEFTQTSAWMPTSLVPRKGGGFGKFPHLLDRYKPGVIGVGPDGRRFCNESESYHDVGAAMIAHGQGERTHMWLICDQVCLSKYGLGYVKPSPMPVGGLIRKGYLKRGRTLAELARQLEVDPQQLVDTVTEYNGGALVGEDRQFGRGTTSFNRYLADPRHRPNPCVAPLQQGPFYAVKVFMGDLGTFDGIRTDVYGQVLDSVGTPLEGLYAVGNDRRSIMGGSYPAAGITLGPIMTFGYITGRHLAGIDDDLACKAPTAQHEEEPTHGHQAID